MTLRFAEEEFNALDDKRHAERTSFQAVGYHLFMSWLQGERKVEPTPVGQYDGPNADAHRALDQILSLPSGDVLRETIDAALTIQRNKDSLTSYPSTHNLQQTTDDSQGIYKTGSDKR